MRTAGWILWMALPLTIACSHAQSSKTLTQTAPPVAREAAPRSPAPELASPAQRACTSDDRCAKNELCVDSVCVAASDALCRVETVRFDFDKAELANEDLATLQRVARCLKALPPERTLVAGNCDERGTIEYNLALGGRRARAVVSYLVKLGVTPSLFEEVSYGKELPLCREPTSACRAQNRRVDVTRGGKKQAPSKVAEREYRAQ